MDNFFLTLINMSITANWTALAVILLRLLLKKAPRAIVCIMWALVGVRLVLPFSVESVFSLIPSANTVPLDIVYAKEPQIHTGISSFNSAVNPIITESFAPTTELTSINPIQVWLFVAEQIWAIGIVAMLVYTAVSYLRLRLRVREAVKQGDIWLCDRIDTPFILGVLRPRIYVPSSTAEGDIEYIKAHEKAHIRRRDYLWKPLGFALLTVYWFNPVMWVAYILLCRDIESACDEKVLKEKGTAIKKAYSDALINASAPRKLISACPLAFGETSVKSRIKGVLNYKKPAFWIIIAATVICIACAVCFLTNPKEEENNEVAFNGAPLTFDAEDVYTFYPKELVYDCPMYSYVVTAEEAPDYRLFGDLTFEELTGDTINTLGTMKEITLTDSFYGLFDSSGKEIAPKLLGNNKRAWELYARNDDPLPMYYMLLEQKDGTYYICVGHDFDVVTNIRWVYRVNKERQKHIGVTDISDAYPMTYRYNSDKEPIKPTLSLYNFTNTFNFSWSGFSSYYATGKYELVGDTLTCKTDDGLYTFVFTPSENGYVFDEAKSSPIPKYKYSADGVAETPVPNGALFEPDKLPNDFNAVYGTASFDIDSDGEEETLVMTNGTTFGLFTLRFYVVEKSGEQSVHLVYGGPWSDFYFHTDENGKVTLCTVDYDTGKKFYREMSFNDGALYIEGLSEKISE